MLTDRQRATYERRMRLAFAEAGSGRVDELLGLLGNPPDVANVPASFWASMSAELVATLGAVIVEIAVSSAQALGDSIGIRQTMNWSAVNERAASWAARYTYQLVNGINVSSRAQLQGLVSGFFRSPEQDLKGLGVEIGKLFGPVRGDMIAVTEATRAAGQGEEALVDEIRRQKPGSRIVQIWQTSNDELVCPICGPLHGKRRGDGWTQPPPAHPRCRCAMGQQIAVTEVTNA